MIFPLRREQQRAMRAMPWLACRPVLVMLAAMLAGCVTLPTPPQAEAERERQERAELAEQARIAARPASICRPQPGSPFVYRKKVLILAMQVARPLEAADLPGLSSAWSHALQGRVRGTNRFLVRDGSGYFLDPADDSRRQVLALADRFDAQFVIAGRILNMAHTRGYVELGVFARLPNPAAASRVIETELTVFDGHSGAELGRANHAIEVRGRVVNDGLPTLKGDFFNSQLGEALATLLERQGEDIEDELACLPMQARIVRVRQHEVHIDAGFTSDLTPGDRLRIYQHKGRPTTTDGRSGWAEEAYGELLIKQVFPESAVGYLDGGKRPDWQFNGFVRAW